jgi:glutamate-1-semialdehyde 2,1-aminomutase
LSGGLLAMAAMRATLENLLIPSAYAPMLENAARLEAGLQGSLARRALPWCVTRLGARCEFQFCASPPRNGSEARAAMDDPLEQLIHLALLNRGVLITPFHNMMLVSPVTGSSAVDDLLAAFDEVLDGLCRA